MNPPSFRVWPRIAVAGLVALACSRAGLAQSTAAPADAKSSSPTGKSKPVDLPLENRPAGKTSGAEDDTIVMSPFEVTSENGRGYYAPNTMSGTRLNTKLEDLASAITVVTKQQMTDFAMIDVNDVFLYEAGTEGIGNYTDFSIDRFGNVNDNIQANPQGANRVRAVGAANSAYGNYQTTGRMPVDPIILEGVEISRGPNSSIFGLGNASGTVNLVPATASVQKNHTQVQVRGDSYDGYRASFDHNQVLLPNKLALRASAVYQHTGFERKPSGTDAERYNVMFKYQPFKYTTIRASYLTYHEYGTRANAVTPRDAVSYWKSQGSPSWDPITQQIKINGAVVGTVASATATPPSYFQSLNFGGRSNVFVDQNGIGYWGLAQATNGTTPGAGTALPVRLFESAPAPIRTAPNGQAQLLFSTIPAVSDRSLYDWTSVNTNSVNYIDDRVQYLMTELEQFFINNDRQMLGLQIGWFHEHAQRYNRNLIGTTDVGGLTGVLFVDVNEKLPDGRANPYFGRPYIGVAEPYSSSEPVTRDTVRAQLAYRLDFTGNRGWSKWLGLHQIAGYAEYKDAVSRRYRWRDALVSNVTGLATDTPRANQGRIAGGTPDQQASPAFTRNYFRYYVGDANGQNVDYAPSAFNYGTYPFEWYSGATGAPVIEQATLGPAATIDGSAGQFSLRNILQTQGVVEQSHLADDRLVTTLGVRKDRNHNMTGANPRFRSGSGTEFDYVASDKFNTSWVNRSGRTTTIGVVLKPKPITWISFFANKADSFIPETPAQNLLRQPLPDPQGKGTDYGINLNLFGDKLVLRAERYTTKQIQARAGQSAVLTTRALRIDFIESGNDPFALNRAASAWVTAANPGYTQDQIDNAVANIMGLSKTDLQQFQSLPTAETNDILAKGEELELNYNPTRYWTMKLTGNKEEAIDQNLSPNLPIWLEQRLKVWQTIIDPRNGQPWFNNVYDNTGTPTNNAASAGNNPALFYQVNVITPLKLQQATEGKSRPQVRKYHLNYSTNFQLAGISDNTIVKRFNVGGALRWESKGAIGYYGKPPASVGAPYTEYDADRPIYDQAHTYVDMFVGYRTKIYHDRIGATVQLNVRNLFENGGLQPVGAFPDGTYNSYRIIDPRQFILTVTLDL